MIRKSRGAPTPNWPEPAEPSSTDATARKTSTDPQTFEEWAEQAMVKMEELSRNETLRQEIGRKLF